MSQALPKKEVDFVNYLNVALMLCSCALAFYLPFEVLLVSYAFLGPLHYLTEISWLHDRSYFTGNKFDPLLLVLPAIPITIAAASGANPQGTWVALVVGATFGAAAAMTFCKRWVTKVAVTGGIFLALLWLTQNSWISLFLALLLPSITHVFFFTGAFILLGALKSKSFSGYISLLVFVGCAVSFFVVPTLIPAGVLSPYVQANVNPFLELNHGLGRALGANQDWQTTVSIMRFLAYAYTYHYLNWFSKTKIIRWHEVSGARLACVAITYAACIALYLYDYALGFVAAYFLSLIHVFLEFPLNHHSFVGISAELRHRVRASS